MPNPTTAAEWIEKCNQDYLTSMRVEGRSNGHLRHGLCLDCADAYARQQVERYALTVDDPASMHLHYDGCPFKPYADKFDVDIPDPRPECTCAEAHKAAYWKGQWSLEQAAGRLKTRQQVEAFRERVENYDWPTLIRGATQMHAKEVICKHGAKKDYAAHEAMEIAAAIRALPM